MKLEFVEENIFKVGSHAYQVIELDKRIKRLTNHLKNFRKDNATKLSLFKLVCRKKRFLKYLKRTNPEQYAKYEQYRLSIEK